MSDRDSLVVETVCEEEDESTSHEADANIGVDAGAGADTNEDVPKESDPPVASSIIIDFDYISNSFQHDPRAKEIIGNGYLDFNCSPKHERETFCGVSIFVCY